MARLPEVLRQTLTWDRGSEMTNHAQIAEATGLDIYFADPGAPWQRGTNENTNGLLRQYFPKGTDLSVWGPGILEQVAREMNNRPRKTLALADPSRSPRPTTLPTRQPTRHCTHRLNPPAATVTKPSDRSTAPYRVS